MALAEGVQAKLVRDLRGVHGVRQILLVGEDQEHGLAQLVLVQHAVQLVAGLADTVAIVRVDDENQALRVLEVMAPKGADLVLTAHVPHGERDVLVVHGLHVETDGGDGGDDLTELQLIKNGGLTGSIETDHKDTHLLLGEQLGEELADRKPHGEIRPARKPAAKSGKVSKA